MVLLTGPSGAGKSTLSGLLERRGWDRLDGDALAKSLYVPGSALLRSMTKTFGTAILNQDLSLDSQRLGEIVFPNAKKRAALNRLVYPPFIRALRAKLRRASALRRPTVVEVAVYFDLGAPALGLPVVLVSAPMATRVRRLRALGLPAGRALARARALRFGAKEARRADLVLDGAKRPRTLLLELEQGLAALKPKGGGR
jgi:dephospho-CoA kinase